MSCIEDLDPLLAQARAAGDRVREVELLLMRSRGFYVLARDEPGHAEKARESYALTYALAKEIGDKRAMCRALIPTQAFVDYWRGYRDEAIANIDEARALALELGDEEFEIETASARLRFITTDEVHAEALRVRERLEARRDPLRLREHLFYLMWHHYRRGELLQCVKTCDEGIDPGTPILHKGRFTRGKGKFHVIPYKDPAEMPDKDYPYFLTTGRMFAHYHTGTMTRVSPHLDREQKTGYVEINPADADVLAVQDGDALVLTSPRGSIEAPARVSWAVTPGTLFLPMHFSENPTNVLTNAEAFDPLAKKIPEYKVGKVRVEKRVE